MIGFPSSPRTFSTLSNLLVVFIAELGAYAGNVAPRPRRLDAVPQGCVQPMWRRSPCGELGLCTPVLLEYKLRRCIEDPTGLRGFVYTAILLRSSWLAFQPFRGVTRGCKQNGQPLREAVCLPRLQDEDQSRVMHLGPRAKRSIDPPAPSFRSQGVMR